MTEEIYSSSKHALSQTSSAEIVLDALIKCRLLAATGLQQIKESDPNWRLTRGQSPFSILQDVFNISDDALNNNQDEKFLRITLKEINRLTDEKQNTINYIESEIYYYHDLIEIIKETDAQRIDWHSEVEDAQDCEEKIKQLKIDLEKAQKMRDQERLK